MTQPLVLIVEDDSRMADTLASMVRLLGYETLIAHTSRSAVDITSSEDPDLILLDLNLPDVDGFELCSYFKRSTRFKDKPVIFVSAENDTDVIARATEVGAARYLVKPVGIDDLETAIAESIA